jgi:hypothetical protein
MCWHLEAHQWPARNAACLEAASKALALAGLGRVASRHGRVWVTGRALSLAKRA